MLCWGNQEGFENISKIWVRKNRNIKMNYIEIIYRIRTESYSTDQEIKFTTKSILRLFELTSPFRQHGTRKFILISIISSKNSLLFFFIFLILKAQKIWTRTLLDYERTTVDYHTHHFFLQALQILTREYFLLRNFFLNQIFIHESEKNHYENFLYLKLFSSVISNFYYKIINFYM